MGWTSFRTDRPTKEIIIDEMNFSNEKGSGRVVAIATKLNVSYVAYERSYAEEPARSFVMAVVVLHSRKQGDFCYKTISEDMGPYECNCPASILDLLSPVETFSDGSYAGEWRAKCRAAIEKQRKAPGDGATIRFKEPLTFTNGDKISAFTIHKHGRKVRFSVVGDNNPVYRISNWKRREYEIV